MWTKVGRKKGGHNSHPSVLSGGYSAKGRWYCQLCGEEKTDKDKAYLINPNGINHNLKRCQNCLDAYERGDHKAISRVNEVTWGS